MCLYGIRELASAIPRTFPRTWSGPLYQRDKLVAEDHHKTVKFPEQTKQAVKYHPITQNQSETQFPANKTFPAQSVIIVLLRPL